MGRVASLDHGRLLGQGREASMDHGRLLGQGSLLFPGPSEGPALRAVYLRILSSTVSHRGAVREYTLSRRW